MDEDKTNQNLKEERIETTSNNDLETERGRGTSPNIQIHGGCGLGAVTLISNDTSKIEASNFKIKESGKM